MDWARHDQLVRRFLIPGLLGALPSPDADRRIVFHRQVLLYLTREACVSCPADGTSAWNSNPEFSKLVLMANDQLGFPSAPRVPEHNNLGLLSTLITAGEGSRFPAWRHKLARTSLLVSQVIDREPNLANQFDVSSLFEQATSVPLRMYLAMIMCLVTKLLTNEVGSDGLPQQYSIDETWFGQTVATAEHVSAFLADMSASPDQISETLRSKATHIHDFGCFSNTPLLRVGGKFHLVDLDLVASKAETGIFWRVLRLLPRDRQNEFFAFWGLLFEKYANWLLSRCLPRDSVQFLPDPRWADDHNSQVCDSIVISGNTACFLEYKGVVFNTAAKYSGDYRDLLGEIDLKLIGTERSRKGVLQLINAISEVSPPNNRSVEGLDMSRVSKIVPILVPRDDIAHTFCFNEYLNYRFKKLTAGRRMLKTTPLFVLSLDDFERIVDYLDRSPLHAILEERWRNDKAMVFPFFAVKNSNMPDGAARPPKAIIEGMEELTEMTKLLLFGTSGQNL
jgi:hypothetical protein